MSLAPGVTGVVMVKNDAERLAKCIASLKAACDRVIVLDTGSTDHSVEVARGSGVQVMEHPWTGGFDTSLNILLDAVETEWTFRLDSDEWVVPGSEGEVRRMTQQDPRIFLMACTRRNFIDTKRYTQDHQPRLWRTAPDMRFQGVVHEQFPKAVIEAKRAAGGHVALSSIRILHVGYVGIDTKEKHRRNAELVRKELELRPGQIYYEVSLADSLHVLGDPEGTSRIRAIVDTTVARQAPAEHDIVALPFQYEFDLVTVEDFESERVQAALDYTRKFWNDSPLPTYAAALLCRRLGRHELALEFFKTLHQMGESKRFRPCPGFAPEVIHGLAWIGIAEMAGKLGQLDLAAEFEKRIHNARRG